MAASIFYAISIIAFFFIFLLVRKDDTSSHSAAAWMVVHAAVIMWINNFFYAVYSLIGIPTTLVSVAVGYLVLSVVGLFCIRRKGVQKLSWRFDDFAFILIIVAVAYGVGLQYHTPHLQICDCSGDICTHYMYAMRLSNTGWIRNEMFYAPVNNGLFISLVKPVLNPSNYYKGFIAMGIMMLALSGCAFYAALCDITKRFVSRLAGLIVSLMYMLGYPLHNELMGFCYLGMSVTIVVLLAYFLRLYIDGTMQNDWAIVMMMLGCFALVMCYMLFAPVVYIALFVTLAIARFKEIGYAGFAKLALKVFLIPCVLGLYYCYFCFFKSRSLSVGNAVVNEGGTRGRFYVYLLILFPGTVYFLISDFRRRKHLGQTVLFCASLLFSIGVLTLVFRHKMSIYYYSKTVYLLWYAMSMTSYLGLKYMLEDDKKAFVSCTSLGLCLFLIWAFNVNDKLAKRAEAGYAHYAENFRTVSFGIYDENLYLLSVIRPYSPAKLDLYNYVRENLNDETIPLLADYINYLDFYWYQNMTGQDTDDYFFLTHDINNLIQRIGVRKETKYVMLLYDTSVYKENTLLWRRYKKVYDNDVGCILKLK